MIPLSRVTLLRLIAVRSTSPDFRTKLVTFVARLCRRVSVKHVLHFFNLLFCKPFTVNNKVRIIRGCGYINDTMDSVPEGAQLDKHCTKQMGSVVIEYCVCNTGDGCNSVGSLSFGLLTTLLPLAVLVAFLGR